MVKWLQFKDKEQRQNNDYENAGYSEEGNLDQINDEMADADSKNDENQETMINTNDEWMFNLNANNANETALN